ncbi:MAG: ATP-binding region ATPase domain protein [Gemmatimonadetes bacterium]|nr:ATP-binding region ATPase domain protein [Gemmatimonadota bacterium]
MSFESSIGHVRVAFAVTTGPRHVLAYSNAAFEDLVRPEGEAVTGAPIATAFPGRDTSALVALLDRAFRTGTIVRSRLIGTPGEVPPPLSCSVWPNIGANGEVDSLLVEIRTATPAQLTISLQRQVAERLLLSALRELDAAAVAESARRNASFLSAETRRLSESLDEDVTLRSMRAMSLPRLGDWCIVDTLGDDDTMHRLAIVHPDASMQSVLLELDGSWEPHPDDQFGLPAALRTMTPATMSDASHATLANSAHDAHVAGAVAALGSGHLLTVPLMIRERLIGAVTFVGGRAFTADDVKLADDLASRSAMALDRARLHGEAIHLRERAEAASEAKSAFLGMMSHELRTPLQAIGGFVDLIDLGIHGPVSAQQRTDLARIRASQRYLVKLVNDLLSLTKLGVGQQVYDITDVDAGVLATESVALTSLLISAKMLTWAMVGCETPVLARADAGKVSQILVNLLTNAIKCTPEGGHLSVECATDADVVRLSVVDNGIGIPADQLETIFEAFTQVNRYASGAEGGIGLGLSISRSLARGMNGELLVESMPGEGSRFTLVLPRA